MNGAVYKQLRGVGTGYHSSVAYSEIITHETLLRAIKENTPVSGLSLYVDDMWALWHGSDTELDVFVSCLNSIWPGFKFVLTMQDEQQSLVFLDLNISIVNNSSLKTQFYRKETHSERYLHFSSHCPDIQKINIVKNETRRIINNCTLRDDAAPHLAKLRENLVRSGYPEHFISKHMDAALTSRPSNTTRRVDDNLPILCIPYVSEAFTRVVKKELKRNNIEARVFVRSAGNLRRKYHRPLAPSCECDICGLGVSCCKRHVIYDAKCKHCNEHYIGVTTRRFSDRFKEHEASIRLQNEKSALSDHVHGSFMEEACPNPDKSVQGFEWSFIDHATTYRDSFLREGVQINTAQPTINRNTPGWVKYMKI